MNLLKSLATVSLMTLFSRILGFFRDIIIANIFGAGMEIDAFFVAFKLPNLLRRIFAEGAFSQAFVPILVEYKNNQSRETTQCFISYIFGLLTLILSIITLLGVILAPWIIAITAPGFIEITNKFRLAGSLLRITFPYILFISLASLSGAILNTWNQFLVPAFTPALLNISIIFFLFFTFPIFHSSSVTILAWAVVAGGILQFVCQLPYLKKIDMLVLPRINIHNIGVIRVICQMGTAIIGVSVNQISLIVNNIFASFLISGSISWIYYADRLMEFPSSILGVALGTVLLPSLSKSLTRGNKDEYSRLMDWGLRLCFMLVLPSAIALGILSKPLIVVLFQYGKFTAYDTIMTQYALIAYSLGLIGITLVKVLTSGFYSQHNIKTPAKIAIVTFLITQLMNCFLISPLKHVGLCLSISLSSCINAALLYWQIRKKNIFCLQSHWGNFLMRIFIALMVMILGLIITLHMMPPWEIGKMWWRILRLLFTVSIGASIYLLTLVTLGFRLKHFQCPIL